MEFIDSHAHLDFEDFDQDFVEVLVKAENAGVTKILNIGADVERSKAAVILAENNPNIWATVGVHPDEAASLSISEAIFELEEMIKSSRKVVGIGECGLDYFRLEHEGDKQKQINLFEAQIELAKKHHLPLVIHIRNGEDSSAFRDAVESLMKFKVEKAVVHCFTFGVCEAKELLNLDLYIGFTGIVTYKNAPEIQEAAKFVPLDKLLIETDCPFLSPGKYRGKRNEPAYVVEVAQKIAELKGVSLEEFSLQTTKNVLDLFHL